MNTKGSLPTVPDARLSRRALSWLPLLLGAACFTFVGWRFNVPFAAWLAPFFLIRFFRDRARWTATLPAILLLAVASFIQMNGGWDMDAWMAYTFAVLRPAAFLVALYADRALVKRLPRAVATLVYPAVYLVVDYGIAFTPLGSGMSLAATQLGMPGVSGLASITGIWGIGFLVGWTASVLNTMGDARTKAATGDGGATGPTDSGRGAGAWPRGLAVAWVCVLTAVFAFGGARAALARPSSPTVRVGAVTINHVRDYWAWIDQSTPRELVAGYTAELTGMEDSLFAQSERAAAAGAKIIFWSEGNGVIPEEQEAAFMTRAANFARSHEVYFAPAVVVLRYGQTISDNKVLMFAPDGRLAFTYVKTMSWYPTGSDGILKTVATPYGRIGAAICFDMDFPSFIHALGAARTDIVLVPAFDRERIRPYHTEVGLLRGIENGFSVVRMTNQGTSMAMDASGRVLARQEFFETSDRLMLADVPTARLPTLYAVLGEWFPWTVIALAVVLVVLGALSGRLSRQARAMPVSSTR